MCNLGNGIGLLDPQHVCVSHILKMTMKVVCQSYSHGNGIISTQNEPLTRLCKGSNSAPLIQTRMLIMVWLDQVHSYSIPTRNGLRRIATWRNQAFMVSQRQLA